MYCLDEAEGRCQESLIEWVNNNPPSSSMFLFCILLFCVFCKTLCLLHPVFAFGFAFGFAFVFVTELQ